ncbi:glutamate/gamma-aminobutyrate family transporter YjeM [Pediococcus ethanolidurans]|uniref:glutamate/gamma-aminobutyrate family transporter YjeM n=1 Tax=Pediococcus ethanolidurans TaxID=319653 RepID=UPI0029534FBC|nr:glutamate/gamma-aminobutyrate family transporter YjeM [Pediococcus ethanolidurans]MDV7719092.1 glutamate/gamma-aminobutyrate family transporter YjeM [Pediococcus ethanolidurans]
MGKTKKISVTGLILMIFTSIFGFANTTVAFDQMGYASIIWYVIAAFLFFLPSGLMFAEYGSTFKDAKGGIYSWLEQSIGEKLAFIGTFIWLSSWIIWMVSTSSKVWIPFSTIFAGHDATQNWHLFGLNATQTVGLMGVLWILVVTYCATRGITSIAKVSSIGGIFVSLLNVVLFVVSLSILFLNHGQLAEPFNGFSSIVNSPNPSFMSPVAMLSFIVYAVFAYGGMESMGGVTDSLKKPEKTFPRGIIISTIMIGIMYALSIFLWGISTNWHQTLSGHNVDLGNITYVMMNNLGFVFGNSLGLNSTTAITLGHWFARFAGLGMFMAYLGSFFVLIYSPLKSFILGSPKKLWPAKVTKLNKAGVPAFAMWCQAAIVAIFVFFISFGGSDAQSFYTILTDMANISTTFPYLFLIGAFPFFKRRHDLNRPFVIYKTKSSVYSTTILVLLVLIFGIIFTVIEPILEHDLITAFWTIIGPVLFGAIAWIFYVVHEKN